MRKEYITSAGTMRLLSWHNTRHSFEPHFHDLLFLGVILEGACHFQSLGRWYEALPGDVVVIPAFTEHAAFCNKETRYRALYLKEQEFVDMLRKGEHQRGLWRANVSVIKAGDRSKRLATAMQACSLSEIQEAVVALMGDHDDVLIPVPPLGDPVMQLLDSMVNAARLHLPVAAIADTLGYTPFAFSRLFQRHVGMRAVFFRNQMRLLFAEEQLLSGYPVSTVAACWGYADQAHFTRELKKFRGVTPRNYSLSFQKIESSTPCACIRYESDIAGSYYVKEAQADCKKIQDINLTT